MNLYGFVGNDGVTRWDMLGTDWRDYCKISPFYWLYAAYDMCESACYESEIREADLKIKDKMPGDETTKIDATVSSAVDFASGTPGTSIQGSAAPTTVGQLATGMANNISGSLPDVKVDPPDPEKDNK